jgi:hypothetical protein
MIVGAGGSGSLYGGGGASGVIRIVWGKLSTSNRSFPSTFVDKQYGRELII